MIRKRYSMFRINPKTKRRHSFASFLWSLMWKEKKSFSKPIIGILNIPRKKLATCLVKCKGGDCGTVYFGKVVAPLKCKKTAPTIGRECLFAARFLLSGDFYRVGTEVFQIVKKSFVFGHSPAKQVPQ